VIDCTRIDRTKIAEVLAQFAPIVGGQAPDWGLVEADALDAGRDIGGCALAELVQNFASAHPAPATVLPTSRTAADARATLEDFRARYAGGATYHTPSGDL
jgi:hypothetical protein